MQQPAQDELKQQTVLLIFLMVAVMSLFSISLLVIMVKRSLKIWQFKVYRVFIYISFYIASKILTCTLLLIKILAGIKDQWKNLTPDSIELIFKDSIICSEISMAALFLVTFEFYYIVCMSAMPTFSNFLNHFKRISKIVQIFFMVGSFVLLLLFNIDVISYNVINIVEVSVNCALILWFVLTFFYLTFQMTGIMLPKKRHSKMNKIYKLMLLLLFSRFITSTAEWLIHFDIKDGDFGGFIELMKSKDQFILQACIFIGYIVYVFLTEAVPLIYCIKKETLEVFLKENSSGFISRETVGDRLITDQNLQNLNGSHYEISIVDVKDLNSFSNLEPLAMQSQIWGYYKGKYNNRNYFIRKANEEISMYLMEDVIKEILEFREKNIKVLNPMGYFEEQNFFFIYEPWRTSNLNQYLKDVEDMKKKLEVMASLASAISVLHQSGTVHGCLTPNNIFVIQENEHAGGERIVVSGYGLQSFKRYLSMTSDYSNKTLYSSVELLQSKNPIIINPKKQSDSYSFGMILYEIVTKNTSIQQLSLEEIEKMMCQENTRPKIPDGIQREIKELIRKCWSKNTETRPSMSQIGYEIKQILKTL